MSVGPPGGRQCEECGATRWDQKQVHGWIDAARRERDEAQAERDELVAQREVLREWMRGYDAVIEGDGRNPDGDMQDAETMLLIVEELEAERNTAIHQRDEAEAERDRLYAALADLLEGAQDMRDYVPEHFARKWEHDEYMARAIRVLLDTTNRSTEEQQMPSDMNTISLVARLTRDPELRTLPSGQPVCEMRVAFNTSRKTADGWEDAGNFVNVTVWGSQGEAVARNMSKGQRVGITGRLQHRTWKAEDGSNREQHSIVANTVQYLDPKGDRAPAPDHTSDHTSNPTPNPVPVPTGDDDVPF